MLFGTACSSVPRTSPSDTPPQLIAGIDDGSHIVYPRVAFYRTQKLTDRINLFIAAKEMEDRKDYQECHTKEKVKVSYLSDQVLSFLADASWFCGAYPDEDIRSLTIYLPEARVIDWNEAFVPGFFPDASRDDSNDALYRLYRPAVLADEHIDAQCAKDPVCASIKTCFPRPNVDPTFGFSVAFAGDNQNKKLWVYPQFSHVNKSCATPVLLPFDAVKDYLIDNGLRAELGYPLKVNK